MYFKKKAQLKPIQIKTKKRTIIFGSKFIRKV